ncbi:lysophospholipid acyltransferase family protein [Fulvimarina sp. 2208YS6-2-32]|uniref:Lysophospholipid acyltransferase family protein n=1 Tax=Fulvimarina uroteuthidis TaxID=3098149 RepID=A0ABU5I0M8_9HYPH|nr:lysophospholipid acyltransferase family protein [Fulvimarina sp. 2208YS6-2-32]MDY8108513.1 lysophospholipid acyltransferase family protein [Fulvimarina sp. 2208YS6-2-32]
MLMLRSIAFQVLFYVNFAIWLSFALVLTSLLSEKMNWRIVNGWCRMSLWLLRHVAGTRSVVTGLEHVPTRPSIIASKHQSFWDIIALVPHLDRPTFILKQELMRIPVFGRYARKLGMIPIDRAKRGGAIASMLENATIAAGQGRQIVIFPEGTRCRPGAAPDYRQGIYRLYETLAMPVVPVALNSGLYWPRKDVRRWPGTIRADFLEPIPAGLSRVDFFPHLRGSIEKRSDELLAEAYRTDGMEPLEEAGREKLREILGRPAG